MKRKFKLKKNKIHIYKLIIFISFLYVTISIIYDGKIINIKNILLRSALNSYIDEESYLLKLVDVNITTPKNILYSSLNKIISKEDLSIFNYYDDYDSYEKNKSEYVEDTKKFESLSPLVYIYNTHQLEEYSTNLYNDYSIVPNVMIASYTLREKLNKNGIISIVETNNIKEYLNKNNLNYNYSYYASRYFLNIAKSNHNTLNYFIDIHRDSASLETTLLEINNKKYARIMFVVGLDNKGYENNLLFVNEINNKMETRLPGISRGILKKESEDGDDYIYNQDVSENAILIEIGGVDNEMDEVYNTINVLGDTLIEIIKE